MKARLVPGNRPTPLSRISRVADGGVSWASADIARSFLDMVSPREHRQGVLRSNGFETVRASRSTAPQVRGGPKQFPDNELAVVLGARAESGVLRRARGCSSQRAASLLRVRGALSHVERS